MFHITFRSSSNKEFLATLSDKAFNNFINSQNILNKGKIKILVSLHDKVKAVVNNLFVSEN